MATRRGSFVRYRSAIEIRQHGASTPAAALRVRSISSIRIKKSIGGPSMLSGHRRAASGADSYAHSRTWIHCTSSQKSVCVRKGGHELGCDSQCTEGKM